MDWAGRSRVNGEEGHSVGETAWTGQRERAARARTFLRCRLLPYGIQPLALPIRLIARRCSEGGRPRDRLVGNLLAIGEGHRHLRLAHKDLPNRLAG